MVQLAVHKLLGGTFNPTALFTTGVNGAWYDPSDFSTMFQDAAGTTPVTAVEQPVGLMLDKSKGLPLGPELVTNGDFSNGATGWTAVNSASLTVVSGYMRVTCNAMDSRAQQSFSVTSGNWYKLSYLAKPKDSTAFGQTYIGTTAGSGNLLIRSETTSGPVSVIFRATTNTVFVNLYGSSTNTAGNYSEWDNISVRELPGNHAFNPSGNSANFPVLSARYNLLTKTEEFSDNAAWVKTNLDISANTAATTDPLGGNTSDKLISTGANGSAYQVTTPSVAFGNNALIVNLTDGTLGSLLAGSFTSVTTTDAGNGWWRIAAVKLGYTFSVYAKKGEWEYISIQMYDNSAGQSRVYVYPAKFSASIGAGDGTSGIYIWGADLRVANDALNQPAYQRVNTATDYDTVGFKPYLRFNGVNQWMQTNSINFTATDKVFVSAGVRKLSDYTTQINAMVMLELGPQVDLNNGSFALVGSIGDNTGTKYNFDSKGTTTFVSANTTSASYAAPITSIVSGVSDLGGSPNDYAKLRINGSQISENTTNQGNGPFGTYPLYIGARAGTSFWSNIRFYGAVIAGKQASAAEITNTETFINQKTGAY